MKSNEAAVASGAKLNEHRRLKRQLHCDYVQTLLNFDSLEAEPK